MINTKESPPNINVFNVSSKNYRAAQKLLLKLNDFLRIYSPIVMQISAEHFKTLRSAMTENYMRIYTNAIPYNGKWLTKG